MVNNQGITPTLRSYSQVSVVVMKNADRPGHPSSSTTFLDIFLISNIDVIKQMLVACQGAGDIDRALHLYQHMKARSLRLDNRCLLSLVKLCQVLLQKSVQQIKIVTL